MKDFAQSERQKFIAQTYPHNSLEEKRRRAMEVLGENWVLHSKHAVKKLANPGVLGRVT